MMIILFLFSVYKVIGDDFIWVWIYFDFFKMLELNYWIKFNNIIDICFDIVECKYIRGLFYIELVLMLIWD